MPSPHPETITSVPGEGDNNASAIGLIVELKVNLRSNCSKAMS